MKRIGLIFLTGVLLAIIFYELRWGYETFEVEDVTKPVTFTHKRWIKKGLYSWMTLRIKGDIPSGIGFVNVYPCINGKIHDFPNFPIIKYTLQGKVDKIITVDYYSDQVFIAYKPRLVGSGKVTISASIH